MRTAAAVLGLSLLVAGCGATPAETVWASCDQDVPGYAGVLDGDSIIIRTDPDPNVSQQRLNMEDAACTLGRAGAPDQVWNDLAGSTVTDPVQRASWEGWQAVWSVQPGQVLNLTVTGR